MHLYLHKYIILTHVHIYEYECNPMIKGKGGDSENFRRGRDSPQEGAG